MRGYSTAKAFGKLFKKSPKLACNILGIVILFWGIALLNIFGMYGPWAGISYFLIVSGTLNYNYYNYLLNNFFNKQEKARTTFKRCNFIHRNKSNRELISL